MNIEWEGALLNGKILASVVNTGDEIQMIDTDGTKYRFYHEPDCCEHVRVEDVIGDLDDLVGSPLTMVEKAVSSIDPEDYTNRSEYRESFTWTFYKFATVKGYVTVRFLGESNGYYSESVSFEVVRDEIADEPGEDS